MQILDEVGADIQALIEKDFGPLKRSADLHVALLDWVHYQARLIPGRRRAVVSSLQVQTKAAKYPALAKIARQFRIGGDLSPWLSDLVRKRKADPKADLMFNDWQIHHFHLGQVFVSATKISRTDDLLFAYVTADRAILLDVLPHGSWAMRGLLEILLRVSPQDMERGELKGVLAPTRPYTDAELLQLRTAGLSTFVTVDGRCFSPAFGISRSGHATRLVVYLQNFRKNLTRLKSELLTNNLPAHLRHQIQQHIGIPVRLGVQYVGGQMILYDKCRQLDLMQMPVLA